LHDKINAVEGDVSALSNSLVRLERDVGALSNTLASEHITANDLSTHLAATYTHQSENANFADANLNVSGALTVKGAPIS